MKNIKQQQKQFNRQGNLDQFKQQDQLQLQGILEQQKHIHKTFCSQNYKSQLLTADCIVDKPTYEKKKSLDRSQSHYNNSLSQSLFSLSNHHSTYRYLESNQNQLQKEIQSKNKEIQMLLLDRNKIQQYQQIIQQLNKQNETIVQDRNKLRKKVDEKDKELKKLQTLIQQSTQRFIQLDKQFEYNKLKRQHDTTYLQIQNDRLNEEIKQIKKNYQKVNEGLKKRLKIKQEQISKKEEDQNADLKRLIQTTNDLMKVQSLKIRELNNKLQNESRNNQQLQLQNKHLHKQIDQQRQLSNNHMKKYEKIIEQKEQEIKRLAFRKNQLERQLTNNERNSEQQVKKYVEKVEEMEMEINSFQKNMKEGIRLANQNKQLKQEIQTLKQKLSLKTQQFHKLQSNLNDQQQRFNKQTIQVSQLKRQIMQLKLKLSQQKNQTHELEIQLQQKINNTKKTSLKGEYEHMISIEKGNLKRQRQLYQKKLKQLKDQNKFYFQQRDRYIQQCQQNYKETKKLKQIVKDKNKIIQQLQRDINKFKQQICQLYKEKQSLFHQNQYHIKQYSILEIKISKLSEIQKQEQRKQQHQLFHLKSQIILFKNEMQKLKMQFKQNQQKSRKRQNELYNQNIKLNEMNIMIQKQCNKLQKQISQLKNQLRLNLQKYLYNESKLDQENKQILSLKQTHYIENDIKKINAEKDNMINILKIQLHNCNKQKYHQGVLLQQNQFLKMTNNNLCIRVNQLTAQNNRLYYYKQQLDQKNKIKQQKICLSCQNYKNKQKQMKNKLEELKSSIRIRLQQERKQLVKQIQIHQQSNYLQIEYKQKIKEYQQKILQLNLQIQRLMFKEDIKNKMQNRIQLIQTKNYIRQQY